MVEDDRDIDIETDGDDEVNGRVRNPGYECAVTTIVMAALLPVDQITVKTAFSYSYNGMFKQFLGCMSIF